MPFECTYNCRSGGYLCNRMLIGGLAYLIQWSVQAKQYVCWGVRADDHNPRWLRKEPRIWFRAVHLR